MNTINMSNDIVNGRPGVHSGAVIRQGTPMFRKEAPWRKPSKWG